MYLVLSASFCHEWRRSYFGLKNYMFQSFFLNALANPVEILSNAVWWIFVFKEAEVKLHFLLKLQCMLQQFHCTHEL